MNKRQVTVVVAAAGSGRRFGSAKPKQFTALCGIPILAHTLTRLDGFACVDRIAVSVPEAYVDSVWADMVEKYHIKKVTQVTAGGADRQQSVYRALCALPGDTDIVLIHDGARPFVTERTVRETAARAAEGFAAVAGIKATDTVKLTDANGQVIDTPDRSTVWAAQTPQGFAYKTILHAHERAAEEGFTGTDDAVLVERFRLAPVVMVPGDANNLKITTPEDVILAEAWLNHST